MGVVQKDARGSCARAVADRRRGRGWGHDAIAERVTGRGGRAGACLAAWLPACLPACLTCLAPKHSARRSSSSRARRARHGGAPSQTRVAGARDTLGLDGLPSSNAVPSGRGSRPALPTRVRTAQPSWFARRAVSRRDLPAAGLSLPQSQPGAVSVARGTEMRSGLVDAAVDALAQALPSRPRPHPRCRPRVAGKNPRDAAVARCWCSPLCTFLPMPARLARPLRLHVRGHSYADFQARPACAPAGSSWKGGRLVPRVSYTHHV